MIAIISGSSLPSIAFFSLFFGIMQTGAVGMQLDTNVSSEFTLILQATMVLFVVAFRDYSDIFINSVRAFRRSRKLKVRKNELDN
jgi:simple sugar transport system permease protein